MYKKNKYFVLPTNHQVSELHRTNLINKVQN